VGRYQQTFGEGNSYHLGAVDGDTAYLISGGRIIVIDVSDPSLPHECSIYEPQVMYVTKLFRFREHLVIIGSSPSEDYSETVEVVDVSSPEQPRHVTSYVERRLGMGGVSGAVVHGDDLWLAGGGKVIGISLEEPSSPVPLGEAGGERERMCSAILHVSGDSLFGFCRSSGGSNRQKFDVVDISDPHNPVFTASYASGQSPFGWLFPAGIASGDSKFVYFSTYSEFWSPVLLVMDFTTDSTPLLCGVSDFYVDRDIAVTDDLVVCCTSHPELSGLFLQLVQITELPAITRQTVQNGKLNLQWNEPARGMKLQRSTSLENPDWQDLKDQNR
jgi:hypothetical protein